MEKRCDKCKQKKSLDEFHRSAKAPCGRNNRCRECTWKHDDRSQSASGKAKMRDQRLRSRYGISQSDYNDMCISQSGLCAICHECKTLVVDHCHASGKTRELLCHGCNAALGMFKESALILENAIRYIAKHNQ